MRAWIEDRFVQLYQHVRTDDNWQWLVLFLLTVAVVLAALVLLPYALSDPEEDGYRSEQYNSERSRQIERRISGRNGALDSFQDKAADIVDWLGAKVDWALHHIAITLAGSALVLCVLTVIFFIPAFADDVGRAVTATRTKLWAKYSAEEVDITQRSKFTQYILGNAPAAAATPTTPAATTVATTTTTTPPTGGSKPLTKASFLLWEALIDIGAGVFTHGILERWRRRIHP